MITEEERELIEEEAVRKYQIQAKKSQDAEQLAHYERNLRAKRKHYTQSAETFCTGGQKNRAMAAGAAVLSGLEQLEKFRREHRLIPGTLSWIIGEDRAMDPDGKKGYRYTVAWHIYADENVLTEEEIAAEIEDTRKKMAAETEEMYGPSDDAEDEADGERTEAPAEEERKAEVQADEDQAGDESAAAPWDE